MKMKDFVTGLEGANPSAANEARTMKTGVFALPVILSGSIDIEAYEPPCTAETEVWGLLPSRV
jgi:hypothetical protein